MNPAEDYILRQTEPSRSVLLHLQAAIERGLPQLELKYKYRVPFYYLSGRPFCYLNTTAKYVDLGFWNAAHLTVHLEHLVTAERKIVRSLRYTDLEEIDDKILADVLQDAYRVRHEKFYG